MKFRLTTSILLRNSVVVAICLMALNACQTNDKDGALNNQTRLSIQVAGIEDFVAPKQPQAIMSTAALKSPADEINGEEPITPKYATYTYEHAEILTSSEEGWGEQSISRRPQLYAATQPARFYAATQRVPTNVKYRMMLYYKDQDGNLSPAINEQFSSGSVAQMDLVKGKTYQWVAYSYNDTQQIPAVSDANNPTLQTPTDRELLWATGEFTAVEGSNELRLTFKRRLTAIAVTVTTRDMYGSVTDLSAQFQVNDYIKTGTFNLLTGESNNFQSVGIQDIDFEDITENGNVVEKRALYYTSDPTDLEYIYITIAKLTVKNSSGVSIDIISDIAQSHRFGPYTAALGNKLIANMNITNNTVTVAGLEWARGILYRDRNGVYGFRDPDYSTAGNPADYFIIEDGGRGGEPVGRDYCKEVLPLGTWRMPTKNEYDRLPRYKANHSIGYFEYTAQDNPDDYLRIYALGRREDNEDLDDYDGDDRTAFYWTATRQERTETYAFSGQIELDDDDVDDYGTNDENNKHGYNIRCVRAN